MGIYASSRVIRNKSFLNRFVALVCSAPRNVSHNHRCPLASRGLRTATPTSLAPNSRLPWKEKSKAADVAGVCRPTDDGRRQRRRVIYSPERAQTSTKQAAEGPAEYAEIRLGFCPLFPSQDRLRDARSCLNITFPVLCSSSRHPRAPPRAFLSGALRLGRGRV